MTESRRLADLVSRRLALMPHVAAWKRARGVPIEDRDRERAVLRGARRNAEARGLNPDSMAAFFELQIELAKALQQRSPMRDTPLALKAQLRPRLLELGARIQDSVAAGGDLDARDAELLARWLEPPEIARLLALPLRSDR